jgi:hypothetical protein
MAGRSSESFKSPKMPTAIVGATDLQTKEQPDSFCFVEKSAVKRLQNASRVMVWAGAPFKKKASYSYITLHHYIKIITSSIFWKIICSKNLHGEDKYGFCVISPNSLRSD